MIIDILLILLGFVLLIKGGDWLIDGASNLARCYKISELAIGLTVVAFGTSAPELVVSFVAAIETHPEIAFGNVIGSNNFNLLMILGITGLVAPLAVHKNTVRAEIPISLFAAILLFVLVNYGGEGNILSRIDGVILLVFFALFVYYVFKSMKTGSTNNEQQSSSIFPLWKSLLFIVVGLACLIVGGKIVVGSAVDLARALSISEKIIGLTIVAVGTSLPELVTSITAIRKNSSDIAVGNVIGSNIFNILLILGISSVFKPMEYLLSLNNDIYLLLAGTLLLLLLMFIGKKRILSRWKAVILIVGYIGYVVYFYI